MSNGLSRQGWRVTLFLAVIGAAGGIATAVILTILGNVLSGAPHAPGFAVYFWNMEVFGVFGAVGTPILAWSLLRRVPLWRAVVEPAIGGILGTVAAFAIAPVLFPILAPLAILAAAWRLNHAYRHPKSNRTLPAA